MEMNQERERVPRSKLVSFGYDMISGGVSGIAAKTVSAPIERVKLLLQTQFINSSISVQYNGPIDCTKRILKEEGLLSFWRGNMANVYRYFPQQAMTFGFKDQYRAFFVGTSTTGDASKDKWRMVAGNLVSGGLAGGCATIISYPFELARTRLAVDSNSSSPLQRQYRGTFHCLGATNRREGVRGVYAGLGISLFGSVLFRGLFLGGYDTAKAHLDLEHSSVAVRLCTAHAVTTLTGTLCYPVDTVKRRMMVQSGFIAETGAAAAVTATSSSSSSGRPAVVYRHSVDCLRRILREEGYRALYHGLSANLVRGVSGAFLLVGYDEMKKMFKTHF